MVTTRRATFLVGGLLALAALLAYSNSFSVPLLLDDWPTLLDNPQLGANWSLLGALSPPPLTGVAGRPVANLAFVLNHAVTGDSLAGYHAVNLAIHFLAALALFGVIRRTLALVRGAGPLADHADAFAAAAALLWLLHPVHTESVTYLSQRTESLMGLFYLTTLYCFLRAAAAPGLLWRALAIAACSLGMAAKEGMVTAPVAVLLLDRWFVAGSFVAAWRQRRGLYLSLAATWLLLVVLMRGLHERGVGLDQGEVWWQYALTECSAIVRYLGLALWPAPLVFDYGNDLGAPGVGDLAAATLVAGLIALAVVGTVRKTPWGFFVVWFLLTLVPTSSIVQIPLQPIAENRTYLALAGPVLAVVALAFRPGIRVALAVLGAAALTFGANAFVRNTVYRSETTIWTDTVAKAPGSSRAHANLGQALQQQGRYHEACTQFEAAVAIRPSYARAHANLAGALGALNQHAEAIAHARLALSLDPVDPIATFNLAVGLVFTGRLPESAEAFASAVRLRPTYPPARELFARVLLELGRPAEAAEQASRAIELSPRYADAHADLGLALWRLGRLREAATELETALRFDPSHATARQNLEALGAR